MATTPGKVKELLTNPNLAPLESSFDSSDREQSRLRIAFSIFATLWSESHPLSGEETILGIAPHESVALSFLLLSTIYYFLWIPIHSNFQNKAALFRWVCLISDVSAISIYTSFADKAGIILLPILYLSAIIGYGMRFGRIHLIAALMLSLIELAFVIQFNQFLLNNSEILTCYVVSMLFLPIYTVILLEKYSAVLNAYRLASNQKEEFISLMSHEFRAPLHSIISISESIRLGLPPLDSRSNGERFLSSNLMQILSCAERMLSVANRITNQQNSPQEIQNTDSNWFNTYHDVYLAIKICSVHAKRKRLALSWWIDGTVPCTTTCDSSTLQEILINLLDNAVKHTDRGTVAVTVRFFPLTLSEGTLEISVSDTGVGMATNIRADTSLHAGTRGRSLVIRKSARLGLAITQMAVARLGGSMSTVAGGGGGTDIVITVPVDSQHGPDAAEERWLRILVVGDRALTLEEERLLSAERLYPCYARLDIHGPMNEAPDMGDLVIVLGDQLEAAEQFFNRFVDGYSVSVPTIMVTSSLRDGQVSRNLFTNFIVDTAHPVEATKRLRSIRMITKNVLPAELPETDQLPNSSRVLLMDDSQLTCEATQRVLEMMGLKCEVAGTISEAVEILRIRRVDLILADLYIGDENFLDFLQSDKDGEFSDISVILVTADDSQLIRTRAINLGIHDVFVKPIQTVQLIGMVKERLSVEISKQESGNETGIPSDDFDLDIVADLAQTTPTLAEFLRMLGRFRQDLMSDAIEAQRYLKQGELSALAMVLHRMEGIAVLFGARGLGKRLGILRGNAMSGQLSSVDHNYLGDINQAIDRFVSSCKGRY